MRDLVIELLGFIVFVVGAFVLFLTQSWIRYSLMPKILARFDKKEASGSN